MKPKKEPLPAGAEAGAGFAGAGADVLSGLLLAGALGCAAALLEASGDSAGTAGDAGLLKFAKENAGASLLWDALEDGAVPKPPKPPKPAGF